MSVGNEQEFMFVSDWIKVVEGGGLLEMLQNFDLKPKNLFY